MDFVATPPHCAFCLAPLPPDESVTCRRCETPYCSAECRSNDLSAGFFPRWTEATVDEETGEGVLPPPQSHRSVCADIAHVGIEKHYASVEAREEAKVAVRECAAAVEAVRAETGEAPTCYICLGDEPGLVRACSCRGTGGFAHLECLANYARAESPDGCFSYRWHTCRNCKAHFTGSTRLALARECWSEYCSEPIFASTSRTRSSAEGPTRRARTSWRPRRL